MIYNFITIIIKMKSIKIFDIVYYYMPNICIDKYSKNLLIIISKYIFFYGILTSEFILKIILA